MAGWFHRLDGYRNFNTSVVTAGILHKRLRRFLSNPYYTRVHGIKCEDFKCYGFFLFAKSRKSITIAQTVCKIVKFYIESRTISWFIIQRFVQFVEVCYIKRLATVGYTKGFIPLRSSIYKPLSESLHNAEFGRNGRCLFGNISSN